MVARWASPTMSRAELALARTEMTVVPGALEVTLIPVRPLSHEYRLTVTSDRPFFWFTLTIWPRSVAYGPTPPVIA